MNDDCHGIVHTDFSLSLTPSHIHTRTHMQLGVGNEHHVVVYDNNVDFGFFSAPRVWWMMRVGWFTGGIVGCQ